MENQLLDSEMLENKNGKSLNELLNNGYETHSVEYIKKGFEIFKQNIGGFIGFLFVAGILQIIISSIPFISGLSYAIISPILVGVYIVAKMIDKNEAHTFSNFFDGTKNYAPIFLVTLIPSLIIAVIMLVIGGWAYFKISYLGIKPQLNFNDLDSLKSIAAATGLGARAGLAGVISIVISVLFLFAPLLVIFEKFDAVKALDISRKIVSKKFLNWVGFLFLIGIFNAAGAICLLIGLLITIPTSICAMYVAYNDVIGLDLKD
ncbi:MAG TPA: hypothetical protein PLL99_00575 [Chitinophagales bacterium]|jgi:hypothetical protein|nr:hypothetical protein [Chitinophagales bacterium]HQG38644.1 hypothetical protein [Chitinophagales bacterium]